MAFGFENTLGFFAFLSLIPLIIIYLIKPKPIKQAIPSLMFFISNSKLTTKDTFFRHFQRDWLFLLQLLAILLLAASATLPFYSHEADVTSGHTVFVLDVSASSKTMEDGTTRLDLAKEKIKELTGPQASLVLAKGTPLLAQQNVEKSELLNYVGRLQTTDEESALGEAILLAGELLTGTKGRVIVLSDFITTKGLNTETAKNVLISRGIPVDFVSTTTTPRKNIGIIKLIPTEDSITLFVKNYNEQQQEITLTANEQSQKVTLKPGSIETLKLKPQDDITEITLTPEDDFMTDNKIFVSKPSITDVTIALITNNQSKFLRAALTSLEGVKIDVIQPPLTPKEDYDLYIIDSIDKDKIIAGTFEDIHEKVTQGAHALIHVQKNSESIDYKGLLPIKIINQTKATEPITVDQTTTFTKDIDFGTSGTLFVTDKQQALSLASQQGSSVVAMKQEGQGTLLYYGILEKDSDFKLSTSYPLFWTNLLKFLVDIPDLEDINLKTGTSIQTKDGTFVTLSHAGVFEIGNQQLAVNLLNEKESAINPKQEISKNITNFILETVKEEVKTHLFIWLLALATLSIFVELIYTKYRGEL
ncbi:MAG: VWA domain-containing protein [Candidatus Nanoarchaeia archaeon]